MRGARASGHPEDIDEEQGIDGDEVQAIIGALADIYVDTGRILSILTDEEDGDEEEEMDA